MNTSQPAPTPFVTQHAVNRQRQRVGLAWRRSWAECVSWMTAAVEHSYWQFSLTEAQLRVAANAGLNWTSLVRYSFTLVLVARTVLPHALPYSNLLRAER